MKEKGQEGSLDLLTVEDRSVPPEKWRNKILEIMAEENVSGRYDYNRRKRILWLSRGKLDSWQVFSKDPNKIHLDPEDDYYEVKSYLSDQSNWLEERVRIHEEIYRDEIAKAVGLSERLKRSHPTIFMLRGNTAAGKTTALGEHYEFEKILDNDGRPTGVINVDTYKSALRKSLMYKGRHAVSHSQVYYEGIPIKERLQKTLMNRTNLSLVFDERFSYISTIADLLDSAEVTDRLVRILDLDVSLEVSLIRVLMRDPLGDDPCVGYDNIVKGFRGIRNGRSKLEEIVRKRKSQRISYYLLGDNAQRPMVEVAELRDGIFFEYDPPALDALTQFDEATEITSTGERLIDKKYVDRVTRMFLSSFSEEDEGRKRVLTIFEKNMNKKNLLEVINEHAEFIPELD